MPEHQLGANIRGASGCVKRAQRGSPECRHGQGALAAGSGRSGVVCPLAAPRGNRRAMRAVSPSYSRRGRVEVADHARALLVVDEIGYLPVS